MESPDAIEAIVPLVGIFERLGVRYYVGGSVAATVYGHSRTTQDVDLVADLAVEHVAPILEGIQGTYYGSEQAVREALARHSCFNFIYLPIMYKVDVFVPKDREFDRTAFARIRKESFSDDDPTEQFFVASAEDVILTKLEWFRLGDEVSEQQWRDVTRVIAVQQHALDRPYLEKWAAELGVADLLEKAWSEAPL